MAPSAEPTHRCSAAINRHSKNGKHCRNSERETTNNRPAHDRQFFSRKPIWLPDCPLTQETAVFADWPQDCVANLQQARAECPSNRKKHLQRFLVFAAFQSSNAASGDVLNKPD